mgnify:CR=1 FL=1
MSIMVATGRGAQLGVLMKNGTALEASGHLDTVVFDKTGTLTEGSPRLVSLHAEGMDENEALALAAALESVSEHPLARAVMEEAGKRNLALGSVEGFLAVGGAGVTRRMDGRELLLGNEKLLSEHGVVLSEAQKALIISLADDGQTPLLLARDGMLVAVLGVADPLREETPGVKTALGLGRATLANIRLSLFWAFAYNILLVPVAAGVLLLFGGPSMSPMLAGAAMSLSSVSVVLNALRLRTFC